MSKLQLLANRCPIMGKAIAVRSAHYGRTDMAKRSAVAGLRAFNSAAKVGRAGIHTSRPEGARLEDSLFDRQQGEFFLSLVSGSTGGVFHGPLYLSPHQDGVTILFLLHRKLDLLLAITKKLSRRCSTL
jgi:hypothetical protein